MTFRRDNAEPGHPQPAPSEPVAVWRSEDGEITTTFHPVPDGVLVRFPERADYRIDLAARSVLCMPWPGCDPTLVDSLYENQIAPLLRTWDGDLVIHASGNVVGDCAVGFFGLSRRGKSTLAAAFSREGYPLVTDDGLFLSRTASGFMAEPKMSPLRLNGDSEAALIGGDGTADERDTKALVSCPDNFAFRHEPAPLGPLYHMAEPRSSGVEIRPIDSGEAVDLLLRQTFMLDTGDKARMRKHFEQVAYLAETTPIFSLDYPRDFAQLPAVIKTIAAHVRATRERA